MLVDKQQLIYHNDLSPLSSVPFHQDIACIERLFPQGFPVHLAVHRVVDAYPDTRKYTQVHTHDVDEINILIGDEEGLEYDIQLGEERFRVRSNASIYIPAGLAHAANVLSGSGYFIAVRLPKKRED